MRQFSKKFQSFRYLKHQNFDYPYRGGEAMHDDRQIIALLQKRDEKALQLIKETYGEQCYQIAYRMTGKREDAEECVNDMLMSVWNLIPPNCPDDLRTYLASLVRRNAVNRYKQEHCQKRGGTQLSAVVDEIAELLPSSECVETKVEQRELTAALNAWVKTLPLESRRVFMQRYFMSESVKSIAEKNNMSEGAVKMLLRRIRIKLKEYLREGGLL